MQIGFKMKAECKTKSIEELEDLCKTCELNATKSTHGCVATIFTDDHENFFRIFTKAYIYAKKKQKGAYILQAIKEFAGKEKLKGDIYTKAFHFFFWRKEILPKEASMMAHALEEMKELANHKLLSITDKDRLEWSMAAVSLEKYLSLLKKSSELKIPLFMK